MTGCEQFEGWVVAEADGALRGPDRDTLLAHVAQCPACRARLVEQQQIAGALTADRAPHVSDSEWAAQWDHIAASVAPAARRGRRAKPEEYRRIIRPMAWRLWAPTAIAACVLFAAIWWLTIGSTPRAVASPVEMARAEDASIEEIDVLGEKTQCMIVQTSPEYAAVIWIANENNSEDGT